MTHVPVMIREVMETLAPQPGATIVDGTVGHGGHAAELAKASAPGGLLIALDWDEAMLKAAIERLRAIEGVRVRPYHADYRQLPESLADACLAEGRQNGADAVLLDLGLNAAQIDDAERGISFRQDGPLDMRMDRSRGEPAAAWLNRATAREIENVLFNLGDERWARRIAQVIVDRRKDRPLKTTADLVDCVLAAVPAAKRDRRLHPATRTFQAVRIHVNRELDGLEGALGAAAKTLKPGGVMAVLSYHSGEDRAVKRAFRQLAQEGSFEETTRKPMTPTEAEVRSNPKSRSAKLRGIRRLS
ncbi:MAG: 16S rRNA (cytosine(1402)-N(4))-methyltransferase RsmH [Fimbriimonadaceae bacterium]|nr:16S rRNA (cytosine(1402)-N(4))-methyltransferase RsmH [Fimbriimonadaceae bacterium]QYK59514.1 MAG: 16S rRNA (cytosine(1402)-N(4))-methyltransferase RsmH [Fimbriimonadaceae bacterium]